MKAIMALLLTALLQAPPFYVREGNRVEQEFQSYRGRLTRFFEDLRVSLHSELSEEEAADLLRKLEKAPPPVSVFGYGMLPRVIDIPQPPTPIRSISYSWPVTEGYIQAEGSKLGRASLDLGRVALVSHTEKLQLLTELVEHYRELLNNQGTIDQYVQYNRFWQDVIAKNRSRYDRMTEIYHDLRSGNPETARTIREVLGKPDAPKFIRIEKANPKRIVFKVPVYTDIDDMAYLDMVRHVIEDAWQAEEEGLQYAVEVDMRQVSRTNLYRGRNVPQDGDHIDLDRHVSRFPDDGAVLTTGAQFTYGSVGRYVALGPGDLAPRTLAHEFGHILGFTDGYVRGYADLGEKGFEILELTSFFDDIMSAPREGHVQPTHFKLLLDALE